MRERTESISQSRHTDDLSISQGVLDQRSSPSKTDEMQQEASEDFTEELMAFRFLAGRDTLVNTDRDTEKRLADVQVRKIHNVGIIAFMLDALSSCPPYLSRYMQPSSLETLNCPM